MHEQYLNQTLLVTPETSFEKIEITMAKLGWRRETIEIVSSPLIENEPEFTSWSWNGYKPFVIYTFNPVAQMRVLDVATVPPALRGMIASNIPLLDARAVENLLFSNKTVERLLGIWAMQETDRIDLIAQADRLIRDPDPVIAEHARTVSDRLQRVAEARLEIVVQMKILTETAPKLIKKLNDPIFVRELEPKVEDCKKIFDESIAENIASSIHLLYQHKLPRINKINPDDEIKVTAIPAGLLRWSNEFSEKFPRGYRDIAGWMNPSCIWMSWQVISREAGSIQYDGLVWLDDHWVWLPKVFRYAAPILLVEDKPNSRRVH